MSREQRKSFPQKVSKRVCARGRSYAISINAFVDLLYIVIERCHARVLTYDCKYVGGNSGNRGGVS